MIVVDTSALIAIAFGEEDADEYVSVIQRSGQALVAAPTALEFGMVVLAKHGDSALTVAQTLLSAPPLEIVAFTPDLVATALEARRRFAGRPARLNYGDCMAYALAKSLDAPLLYKGEDFARTDIRSARP